MTSSSSSIPKHLQALSEIVPTARAILALPIDDAELPEAFERYVSSLDAWLAEVGESLPKVLDTPAGKDFTILHQEVLSQASRASSDVLVQLKELKKRGKGILAYTDIFPKKMGIARPRKG